MRKVYGDVDSKFKFVIVASKRAKQLLKGAKPRIKSKSKSLIHIAQQEVIKGLVDYEIVQKRKEEEYRPEDEDFIGEEILKDAEASGQLEESEEERKEIEGEEFADQEEVEEGEEEEIEYEEEDVEEEEVEEEEEMEDDEEKE